MAQTKNPMRLTEIRFDGRLRTAVDPAAIAPNDLQKCTNLRPVDDGVEDVGGDSKINTTALGQSIVNGIHYRKDRPSESHVVVDGADYKPYSNTTAIPSAGDFGATALYSSAGTQKGRYAVAPTGLLARCTGDKALLYGGTKFPCNAFVDNPTAGEVFDYSEQISNTLNDAKNIATIHDVASGDEFVSYSYVGSPLPLAGFYVDINTANNVATTMTVYYWDGNSWEQVSSLSDGTASGGVSLAQDGWVTFSDTQSVAKQTIVEKQLAFWYKVKLIASSTFDGVAKINTIYLSIPMQPVQDLWDGELIPCPAFLRWNSSDSTYYTDLTTVVYDKYYDTSDGSFNVHETIVSLNSDHLAATGHLLIGSPVPLVGVEFSMVSEEGKGINTAAAVIDELSYWDGDSWVDNKATVVDGTLNSAGTISLNKTGWITWSPPTANVEKPSTSLPGHESVTSTVTGKEEVLTDSIPLYYYKIGWNALMSTYTFVYAIRLIPAPSEIQGCSFPIQHAGRLFLCDFYSSDRNAVRYSALDSANVFNGKDSDTIRFGGDEALVAGVSIYNRFGSTESNMLTLAKKGETWGLSGDDPEKWAKYCISDTIGCIAPLTMLAVNVPSKNVTPGVSSNAAIWLSQKGVVMFSGASFTDISEDIADLFDPNHANYIGDDVLPTCTAFVDHKRNEYHLIVPGVSEWVYSMKFGKWFEIDRGTGNYLNGGFPVQDTDGITHTYGFDGEYLRRLEYGHTFDGDDQAFTLKTACLALDRNRIGIETWHRGYKFVQKADNTVSDTISVTHYGDTDTTGTALSAISPAATGKRLSDVTRMQRIGPHTFHEYEFSRTTNGGWKPLFLSIYWESARVDILE